MGIAHTPQRRPAVLSSLCRWAPAQLPERARRSGVRDRHANTPAERASARLSPTLGRSQDLQAILGALQVRVLLGRCVELLLGLVPLFGVQVDPARRAAVLCGLGGI